MTYNNNQKERLFEKVIDISIRPFQRAIITHTCLDTLLYCPVMKVSIGRPWLTILIDDYSRRILGFYLSLNPPSYVSNLAVIRESVKKYSRIPNSFVISSGKEFSNVHFQSFLFQFGCTVSFYPKDSKNENNIEALFRTVKNFVIYGSEPRKSLWTFESLEKSLSLLLDEVYDKEPNNRLGTSPRETFQTSIQSGEIPNRYIRYDEEFKILTYPIVERKVIPGRGIMINSFYYWTKEFVQPAIEMKKVTVKYDPVDLDIAFVYINGGWKKLKKDSKRQKTNF
ncbi:transposase family protein [Bacillus sp. JJ1521]|uniref:integrase catalytic domain-containing protein n=1 Tax=Bacillus sp. JJ1521 TaxID=3122957 RepID=UPI002FFF04D7